MLKKEFKRRDVERMRNLIKGDVGSSSETQIGYNKKRIEYIEGDFWTEGRKTWTIKNGIKKTVSKLSATQLKRCGLSRQKVLGIKSLAKQILNKSYK